MTLWLPSTPELLHDTMIDWLTCSWGRYQLSESINQSVFIYIRQPEPIVARPVHIKRKKRKAHTTQYKYYHTDHYMHMKPSIVCSHPIHHRYMAFDEIITRWTQLLFCCWMREIEYQYHEMHFCSNLRHEQAERKRRSQKILAQRWSKTPR